MPIEILNVHDLKNNLLIKLLKNYFQLTQVFFHSQLSQMEEELPLLVFLLETIPLAHLSALPLEHLDQVSQQVELTLTKLLLLVIWDHIFLELIKLELTLLDLQLSHLFIL